MFQGETGNYFAKVLREKVDSQLRLVKSLDGVKGDSMGLYKIPPNITHVGLKHAVYEGHLLKNVIPQKPYKLYPCEHFVGEIIDDAGELILITNTCMKKHLYICGREVDMPRKKKKAVYQRLSKKQLRHIAECFNGPPSRITIERISIVIRYQYTSNLVCFECNDIARTLGIKLGGVV